jgi:hypothetical protein
VPELSHVLQGHRVVDSATVSTPEGSVDWEADGLLLDPADSARLKLGSHYGLGRVHFGSGPVIQK